MKVIEVRFKNVNSLPTELKDKTYAYLAPANFTAPIGSHIVINTPHGDAHAVITKIHKDGSMRYIDRRYGIFLTTEQYRMIYRPNQNIVRMAFVRPRLIKDKDIICTNNVSH